MWLEHTLSEARLRCSAISGLLQKSQITCMETNGCSVRMRSSWKWWAIHAGNGAFWFSRLQEEYQRMLEIQIRIRLCVFIQCIIRGLARTVYPRLFSDSLRKWPFWRAGSTVLGARQNNTPQTLHMRTALIIIWQESQRFLRKKSTKMRNNSTKQMTTAWWPCRKNLV